jgi:hypothetical protein
MSIKNETLVLYLEQLYIYMKLSQSVPRASIIWLARAVKVERSTPRLHLDRARFAKKECA